jgi:anti-sigma factor RsiW
MPIQCSDTSSLIQTYLDGELTERDLHDFESHIGGCPECSEALANQRSFHRVVRAELVPPPAPDLLRRRIELALDADDEAADAAARRARWAWVLPGASVAAAAAAMMLFIGDSMMPARPFAGGDAVDVREFSQRFASAGQSIRVTPVKPVPAVGPQAAVRMDVAAPLDVQNVAQSVAREIGIPVDLPSFDGPTVTLRYSQPALMLDRRAWVLMYDVETRAGRHPMLVYLLDVRGLDVDRQGRRDLDGRDVWMARVDGDPAIMLRTSRGVGYLFTGRMSEEMLIHVVANCGLPFD